MTTTKPLGGCAHRSLSSSGPAPGRRAVQIPTSRQRQPTLAGRPLSSMVVCCCCSCVTRYCARPPYPPLTHTHVLPSSTSLPGRGVFVRLKCFDERTRAWNEIREKWNFEIRTALPSLPYPRGYPTRATREDLSGATGPHNGQRNTK